MRRRKFDGLRWFGNCAYSAPDTLFGRIVFYPTTGRWEAQTTSFHSTGRQCSCRDEAVLYIEGLYALEQD